MRLASFNVCGLFKETTKRCLEKGCENSKSDILALQETKASPQQWTSINAGYKFILLEHDQTQYGQEFCFSPKYWKICQQVWRVNGQISVAKLSLFSKKVGSKFILIDVYLSTMGITQKDGGKERDESYETIKSVMNKYRNDIVIIVMGYFNSNIGRKCSETCAGNHSRGK